MIDGRHCTRLHFYFADVLMKVVFARVTMDKEKIALLYNYNFRKPLLLFFIFLYIFSFLKMIYFVSLSVILDKLLSLLSL